jgi:hypothetical protein
LRFETYFERARAVARQQRKVVRTARRDEHGAALALLDELQ